MNIYVAFYEAYDANGKFLFKRHVIQNLSGPVTDGEDFMTGAETDAFSEANGFSAAVSEVIIVGIAKL
ncbi:hypothetical protein [Enterobacter quasiroggenkampii]|uniref:hypothetical protein n=1 Tax=Enterobacter quasiroggenkampii TaxID=2497436 RepID=UPI002004C111|nr:hypothetical protein [Enterobacter quasiroggenkampii]MCK7307302.1 hypothetical protein [Enterobacter quasiroggenkampii]